ncbi:FtsX-like permease family protein [Aeromicrobium fastidiosum]|nr:FtsX-like permease family protein [Aeromicrobium fastidiosum]MBP2392603.1 putative ABC transport system permease protein [Aeromicrobium fastidiosum]
MTIVNRWRPALRMAMRELLRHPARSALAMALVGIPVLLSALAATMIATHDVSPAESLPARLGAAEAIVLPVDGAATQSPDADSQSYEGTGEPRAFDDVAPSLAALSGGRLTPVHRGYGRLVIGSRGWDVDVLKTDFDAPATRGLTVLESGRQPRTADDVVVTPALAQDGARIGRTVIVGGLRLKVVGIGSVGTVGEHPRDRAVAVSPSSAVQTETLEILLDRDRPVTWSDTMRWNAEGFIVISRQVVLDPPPAAQQYADMSSTQDELVRQLIAIVVIALVIEVVLLAGPAFAVGVRRQRQELATLAAAGGSPGDLRRIVLAQALVLGVVTSAIAALASVPIAWGAVRFAVTVFDTGFGPFQVIWPAIAAAAALGVFASVVAALAPARQAARSDVIAALSGRSAEPKVSRGWPLFGLALLLFGLVGAAKARNAAFNGEFTIAIRTIVAVVGATFMTPWIISVIARIARHMPLPVRIALRDTDRHRSRSAPAIAAIMASVSAVTALAVASSSDAAERSRDYEYAAPLGTVTLTATTSSMQAAVTAAEKAGGATFTPLTTLGAGLYDPSAAGDDAVSGDDVQAHVLVPNPAYPGASNSRDVAVADAATLRAWNVPITAAQQAVLDRGGALVADRQMISGHTTEIVTSTVSRPEKIVRVSAVAADLGSGSVPQGPEPVVAGAVVSQATADRLGLPTSTNSARSSRPVDDLPVSAVRAAVIAADPVAGAVDVVGPPSSEFRTVFILLAVMGAIAICIGTFSATGLALSDARPDLATLSAVGASPSIRRLVAASQAGVLSFVGAALGVVVGFVPGIAAARSLTGHTSRGLVVDVPWSLLVILVVVVPVVVAAVTAAVTRSRPHVDRRTA